jgi:hypothetical protein
MSTPAVALAGARLATALAGPLRSPSLGPEDIVRIGSSAYQLARSVQQARRGVLSTSWFSVLLIVSAQGLVAELPGDPGISILEELAEGAAAVGTTLVAAFLALRIYDKAVPTAHRAEPDEDDPPDPPPLGVHNPWWQSRALPRGAAWRPAP